MTLIKLTFLFCLFCFTAKQAEAIVRTLDEAKITPAILDSDSEEEDSEKDIFEKIVDAICSVEMINFDTKKCVSLTYPFFHFLYSEHLNSPVSPPPDAV